MTTALDVQQFYERPAAAKFLGVGLYDFDELCREPFGLKWVRFRGVKLFHVDDLNTWLKQNQG